MRQQIPWQGNALAAVAAAVLFAPATQAQLFHHKKNDCCLPPPCCPAPETAPAAPKVTDPAQPPLIEPTFTPEQATAGSFEGYAAAAPNMIGDLFGSGLSISFPWTTQAVETGLTPVAIPGDAVVDLSSFAGLSNAKIAENNSALPINRVYFRYNYFDNTNRVVGLRQQGATVLGEPTFVTTTRDFNTNAFTCGVEKTFLQDLCSLEVRVPFYSTLGSDLLLSNGSLTPGGVSVPAPVFTPADTLGNYDAEFGDLSFILKALLYYTPRAAVAAGLGVTAPTGPDANVQVVDLYSGFVESGSYDSQRTRAFRIDNESWALSPYLGVLLQPNDRLFFQGFCQLYLPIGGNSFSYQEDLIDDGTPLPGFRAAQGKLDGQSFMLVDVGGGYWLTRNSCERRLTGLAALLELHYTTAIEDADIVTLPADGLNQASFGAPQAAPQIGNLDNRVDILNLTVGTVAEFGNRLLVTTGFGIPLRSEDRAFDWEFQLQINYRFGCAPAYLAPPLQ